MPTGILMSWFYSVFVIYHKKITSQFFVTLYFFVQFEYKSLQIKKVLFQTNKLHFPNTMWENIKETTWHQRE